MIMSTVMELGDEGIMMQESKVSFIAGVWESDIRLKLPTLKVDWTFELLCDPLLTISPNLFF